MKVVLPYPDKRLTPNAKRRKHWLSYRPFALADRLTGKTLTCVAIPLRDKRAITAIEGKIDMTITFYPPDARRRDDDGMIGAFKHLRDGIADALGVDDHRFRPRYMFADPCKPGRVEVEFNPPFVPSFDGEQGKNTSQESPDSATKKNGPSGALTPPSRDQLANTGAN